MKLKKVYPKDGAIALQICWSQGLHRKSCKLLSRTQFIATEGGWQKLNYVMVVDNNHC